MSVAYSSFILCPGNPVLQGAQGSINSIILLACRLPTVLESPKGAVLLGFSPVLETQSLEECYGAFVMLASVQKYESALHEGKKQTTPSNTSSLKRYPAPQDLSYILVWLIQSMDFCWPPSPRLALCGQQSDPERVAGGRVGWGGEWVGPWSAQPGKWGGRLSPAFGPDPNLRLWPRQPWFIHSILQSEQQWIHTSQVSFFSLQAKHEVPWEFQKYNVLATEAWGGIWVNITHGKQMHMCQCQWCRSKEVMGRCFGYALGEPHLSLIY